ncbi:MAG: Blue-light-activated protein [bacterium ADurb.Bin236]|nr:MAG: Blue-light-activated protein [bacterium ADurb.Bin236]HOY61683.1 transporter substrate-binding domain-containing protein [bacterium]HPN93266.1 transporter substrate-binding domain-containing protein [bacterium]
MLKTKARGVFLALIACACISLPAGASEPGNLRVGLYENKPKIFTEDDGAAAGIFVDILREIAKEEGWKLQYVKCEWQECLRALEEGRIDLMPDVAYSEERALLYDFNKTPVLESWSQVYSKPESKIERLSDLNGKRIALLDGSIQQKVFQQLVAGFECDVTIVSADSLAAAFSAVREGRADAAVANHYFGDYIYKDYNLAKTAIVFNIATLYFAAAKGRGSEYLQAIDRCLDAWKYESGSPYYRAISRWMEKKPDQAMARYMPLTLGIISALLALAGTAILFLRRQVAARTARLTKAGNELTQSEERFKILFQESPVSIFIHDKETGELLDANKTAYVAYGFSSLDELKANSFWDEPPYSLENALKLIRKAAQEGPQSFEWMSRKVSGEVFWEKVQLKPIVVDGAERVLATCVDITERKRMEEALRDSEEAHRRLFETMSQGIVYQAADGAIISANPAAERILGLTSDQMKGRTSMDPRWKMIEPDGEPVPGAEHPAMEALRTGKKIGPVIRGIFHPEMNEYVWLSITATPQFNEGETTSFQVYSTFEDITEKKRAEDDKTKLQEQLTQSQKMESIGRLAGGVAHDFNNMLSVIIGNSELAMLDLPEDSPLKLNFHEILQASQRSANLTRQLLAFARRQTAEPVILDINETVENMLKMLRTLIGEDIDLVWKPGRSLWKTKIDPVQIDQILANLCVNARDAISGTGKIMVETENIIVDEAYCESKPEAAPGEYVMLVVSDDGCGMDAETREKIFEPFFTTKETGKGTGLGLATVYGIVRQNEGFINIYSEPGKGTVCKVCLPKSKVDNERESTQPERRPVPTGEETILIVEDEPAILKLGKRILETLGYTVIPAETPTEAITKTENYEDAIHLLLTDVIMPEMNGRELAEKIASLKPGLIALFMSGYTANVIAHHGVLEEGVRFVQKPFTVESLARKVRQSLDD